MELIIQMMILQIGNKAKKFGFTLLETIIVLAIMTMFFAISIPLFSRLTESTKLRTSARSVVSALRVARRYAISNNGTYDVVFDPEQDPREYYIQHGSDIVEKKYKLPTGIDFADIGFTKIANTARFTPTGMLDENNNETSIDVTDDNCSITITVERTTGRVRIVE